MKEGELRRVFIFDAFILRRRWLFFSIAIIAIFGILVYAFSAYYAPGTPVDVLDKAKTLTSYASEKEGLLALLSSGGLSAEEIGIAESRVKLLSFYLDSGTVSSDYVRAGYLSTLGAPYQGVSFAIKALGLSFPFMAIYVPYLLWQFLLSHGSFGSKNVMMSPISPKRQSIGDSLFVIFLALAPILIFLIIGSVGLGGSGALIMYERDGGYHSFGVPLLILSLSLSLIVFSLLVAAISFGASLLFKKDYAAYASPALVCVFFLALFSIMSVKSPTLSSLSESGLSAYFPLLSLYSLAFYPTGWAYWASLSAHLLAAVSILFLSYRSYRAWGYSL